MMRTLVVVSILLATAILAGCVGNFGSDPTPATTITPDPGTRPAALTVPPALAPLKTTVTAQTPLEPWVLPGTTVDLTAAIPAGAKEPLTWTWGVAPLLGTAPNKVRATGLDTGSKRADDYLPPGNARDLTFSVPGIFQMHCHPHANIMRANVTVVDGLAGPKHYDVYIEDGATYTDFRFVPENITIPTGAVVTYHNVGSQAHTATELSQDPPMVLQPITTNKGTATLQGNGWTRVIATVKDADGRVGEGEWAIYVAPFPVNLNSPFSAPLQQGAPASTDTAPTSVASFDTKSVKTDYNGTAFINVTFVDAASASAPTALPAPVCTGEFHFKEQGTTQDVLTGQEAGTAKATGRVQTTTYILTSILRQGANCVAQISIVVLYDHVPPAPTKYVDPESLPHQH